MSYRTDIPLGAEGVKEILKIIKEQGGGGSAVKEIHSNTIEEWDKQTSLIGQIDHLYIYTNADTVGEKTYANVKLGDGTSYLINQPFMFGSWKTIEEHISNGTIHITAEERNIWNNKVSAKIDDTDENKLILY